MLKRRAGVTALRLVGWGLAALLVVACSGPTASSQPTSAPVANSPTVAASTSTSTATAVRSAATPTPAAPPTATPATGTATPSVATAGSPSAGAPTAATLAKDGQTVFSTVCARCHGDEGQGITAPAIIGPDASLAKYQTGGGLYDFVSQNMPQDNPGSLDPHSYLAVVSYLLIQNHYLQPNAPVDRATLEATKLTR